MKRLVAAALGVILVSGALSGCSTRTYGQPDVLHLVSSNVIWNDIALYVSQGHVLGANVLLDNPNIDPHQFEPSARQRLMVQQADVAIYTGTDYDYFMQPLLDAADFETDRIVTATKPNNHGVATDVANSNPHYWFSVSSVKKTADRLTATYIRLSPSAKTDFVDANKRFSNQLYKLINRERQIATVKATGDASYLNKKPLDPTKLPVRFCPMNGCANSGFFAPEGLGSYLLEDSGWADFTSPDIIDNVANGVELSLRQMTAAKKLLAGGTVQIFAANTQVATPQLLELQNFAAAHGVTVIKFSETEIVPGEMSQDPKHPHLPYGYVDGMNYYLKQLAALVAK
jgi:zinc/manganese transport system substrate-binding protein